jgi:hypothetical protein
MQVDTIKTNMQLQQRDYYVKLDNIFMEDVSMHKHKHVQASSSGQDLLKQIIKCYEFNEECVPHLQVWSSNHRLVKTLLRLDTMEIIPPEYEFVWVRGMRSS